MSFTYEIENLPQQYFIGITEKHFPIATIPEVFGKVMGELQTFLQSCPTVADLVKTQAPIARYKAKVESMITMQVGWFLPVNTDQETIQKVIDIVKEEAENNNKRIEICVVRASRYAKHVHVGPYDQLADKWDRFCEAIKLDNLSCDVDAGGWCDYELYVTDPTTERDPSKWVTELYLCLSGQ